MRVSYPTRKVGKQREVSNWHQSTLGVAKPTWELFPLLAAGNYPSVESKVHM